MKALSVKGIITSTTTDTPTHSGYKGSTGTRERKGRAQSEGEMGTGERDTAFSKEQRPVPGNDTEGLAIARLHQPHRGWCLSKRGQVWAAAVQPRFCFLIVTNTPSRWAVPPFLVGHWPSREQGPGLPLEKVSP